MKILLCGGVKTPNIANALRPRFKKGGVELLVEKSIDDVKNLLDRGEYFDRAVMMEPGWTNDGTDTNEFSIRTRIAKFIDIVRNYASRVTSCVFVATSDSMAQIAAEESILIANQCKVLIKRPPYNVAFCISLVTSNLDDFDPSLVFELQNENSTTEEEPKIVYSTESLQDNDDNSYDLESVGEFQFNGEDSIESNPQEEELHISESDIHPDTPMSNHISDFDVEFDSSSDRRDSSGLSFDELSDDFVSADTDSKSGKHSSFLSNIKKSFFNAQSSGSDTMGGESEAKVSHSIVSEGYTSDNITDNADGIESESVKHDDFSDTNQSDEDAIDLTEDDEGLSDLDSDAFGDAEDTDNFLDKGTDESEDAIDLTEGLEGDSLEFNDESDSDATPETLEEESSDDFDTSFEDEGIPLDDTEAPDDFDGIDLSEASDSSDAFDGGIGIREWQAEPDDTLDEPEDTDDTLDEPDDTDDTLKEPDDTDGTLEEPDDTDDTLDEPDDTDDTLEEPESNSAPLGLSSKEIDAFDNSIELDESDDDNEDYSTGIGNGTDSSSETLEDKDDELIELSEYNDDSDTEHQSDIGGTNTKSPEDLIDSLFGGSDSSDTVEISKDSSDELVFDESDINRGNNSSKVGTLVVEPEYVSESEDAKGGSQANIGEASEPENDIESENNGISESVTDLFGLNDSTSNSSNSSYQEHFGRGMYIKNNIEDSQDIQQDEHSTKKSGKRSLLGGLLRKSGNNTESDEVKLKTILNTFRNRGSSLVVTGTPCSGTSTLVFNLANIVSNMGYTVLIVDMDTVNRTQAFMSKVAYESVHSLDPENASLKQALNASNSGISKYASIIKPGFHVLTMGLGGDIVTGEKLAPKQKLARFSSSVRNNYNFIIYDIPFNVATDYASDITYTADNIVLACEASNHGIMALMLAMCNIESEDMQEVMFTRSQLCLTKYTQLKKVLDCNVSSVRDILRRLDVEVSSLLGIDPEYYFSNLGVCGIMNYSDKYENSWFSDRAYSDSPEGREEFIKLLSNILFKK